LGLNPDAPIEMKRIEAETEDNAPVVNDQAEDDTADDLTTTEDIDDSGQPD
jgi:hypothetical protein